MSKKRQVIDVDNPPTLALTPQKPVMLTGNFEAMKSYLTAVRDSYKDMVFSTANLSGVLQVKKTMTSMRTSLERAEKQVKKEWFNDPKQIFSSAMSILYNLISEVEGRADEVLEAEDQKRIDGINQAIDAYLAEFGFEELDEKYRERVERKKSYYNKSQNEADTRNDIQAQVLSLLKEQKAEAGNIRLIEKACAKDKRVSIKLFLEKFESGMDVASVIEEIEEEIERLNKVDEDDNGAISETGEEEEDDSEAEENTAESETVKATMAEDADDINFESDLPNRTKTVVVRITYPADCGDAMTELFKLLWDKGIKAEVIG